MFVIGIATFINTILYSVLLFFAGELFKKNRALIEHFKQKKFEDNPYRNPVENTLNTIGIIIQVIAIIHIVIILATALMSLGLFGRYY